MRAALTLLLSSVVLPAALSAAPAPTAAAFQRSVEATKKAMMADPEHALVSAQAAVALARRMPPGRDAEIAVATAEWLHGESLLGINKLAEAEPIVAATLARVERIGPNTKLHGDLLRSYGAIAANTGRVLQALRAYQRAHEVFRAAGQARSQAMALQDIGLIFWDAGDYSRALDYYQQSSEAYSGDPTLTLTMQNNRAEVLRKQERYADAAAAYRAALVAGDEAAQPAAPDAHPDQPGRDPKPRPGGSPPPRPPSRARVRSPGTARRRDGSPSSTASPRGSRSSAATRPGPSS